MTTGAKSELNNENTIAVFKSQAMERDAIGAVARNTGVFNKQEMETVFELFDTYINEPAYGYDFFSAFSHGRLIGFVCWGKTDLTEGTYDLYWICADPSAQQKGVGKALFLEVEKEVKARNGRLIVIWTSGTEEYTPATRFYARMGCELAGRIRDYYRPGDDLLVFAKYL